MEPSFNEKSTRLSADGGGTPPDPHSPGQEAPRESMSSAWSGVKFGKDNCFTLQKLRYQGGMGEIWAAWMNDPRTSRRVAIKIIRPEVLSKLSRELFEREIEMHRRVADVHGVLPLVDSGKFTVPATDKATGVAGAGSEVRYLATEWISNVRSLDQACKDLSWEARLNLFVRICETLDVIHKRAIVHCDLKPHNILIDEQGNPLIADFGLAISNLPTDRESTGLDIGSVRGTWSYMAPEQCAQQCDPYGYKASLDVYALGVTFYECLTGSLPYPTDPGKASNRTEAAKIINEQLHISLRHKGRTLPPQIYAALTKACSSDPTKRYADAGQLGAALRTLPASVRLREWAYGLAALGAVYILFWSVFSWITYTNPTYDLFRGALVKMAPVPTSLDHVAVITTDEATDDKIDALAKLNGLGTQTTRATYAAVLDKLGSMGVRAVAIDSWFTAPGIPEANTMLLEAVKRFENEHNGRVVIAKQEWIDPNPTPPQPDTASKALAGNKPSSQHDGDAINQRELESTEPDRFPICEDLQPLRHNLGAVVQHIDYQTSFLESELIYRHSNSVRAEPGFSLMSFLAYKYPSAEPTVDWRKDETFCAVSTGEQSSNNSQPPLTIELSSIRYGHELNELHIDAHTQQFNPNDAVGLLNVGAVPDDETFKQITITADRLWDSDQSAALNGLDLKKRLVILAAAKESHEPNTRDFDIHDVGNRKVPGHYLQATFIDALIKDQDPRTSGLRARMIPIKLVPLDVEAILTLILSAFMLVIGWWSCSQPSIKRRTRFLITVALCSTGLCLLICIALFLGLGIVFSPFNLMFAMLFSAMAGSLIPWITPVPKRRNEQKTATAST